MRRGQRSEQRISLLFGMLFSVGAIVFPFKVIAAEVATPYGKISFCENVQRPDFAQSLLRNSSNRLSFLNFGRIGFCWWHSRFTMASAYITVFKPNEPRPTSAEARNLVRMIRRMNRVVVIPGFANMAEFSKVFASEIESELLRWQFVESYWWQWYHGLIGSSEVSAEELAKIMDETFSKVVYQNRVLYQMLQFSGISAHSWLVVDMEPISDGYRLTVIDSNSRDLKIWNYHRGMKFFTYPKDKHFVPYTQDWTLAEERQLRQLGREFCGLDPD